MNQILLNGMSVNELLKAIEEIIHKKITGTKDEVKSFEYLSRKDVCKLLKITLPTLNDWTKLGRLQSYKIGNRVLYKQDEVESALHQVGSLKFKRG